MITQSWAVFLLGLCIFGSLPLKTLAQIQPAADGTRTIVTPQGDQFNIKGGTQTGNTLFHSFDRFNLTADQAAIFRSDPSIRNILSRVTGGDASIINGLIQITGGNANLYLMNPAGVLFGASARLDVPAAFGVTTANGIGFGNGRWFWATGVNDYAKLGGTPIEFAFLTPQSGSIFNAGQLIVKPGQSLTLLGGSVLNTGTLSAPGGDITIAAIPGEARVRISQVGSLLSVELPLANQGESPPTTLPKSLPQLLAGGALNDATGVVIENGLIKLTSSPALSHPQGIILQPGTAIISGQVLTHSATAGPSQITLLGDKIALVDATLNASGITGGTIRIGGDYQGQGILPRSQFVFGNDKTQISAEGLNGGGTIVLWADQTMRFYGTLTAPGGQVETSGKERLDITGARVQANTWLLDPADINIVAGGTGAFAGGVFDPVTNTTIDPTTIAAAIDNGTNVTITTTSGTGGNGDITLTDSINQTGGGTASLSLIGRRFLQNDNATINLNSTGSLSFNLNQVNPEATPPTSSIQSAIAAIGNVSGSRTINLSAGSYTGNTTINVNKSVLIRGTSRLNTSISGGGTARILQIAPEAVVGLSDLTITGGNAIAGSGGGILNAGNLVINNSTITNNTTGESGGGVYNVGDLTIRNANISNNTAAIHGGGLDTSEGNTTVNDSTFTNNIATIDGGGIRISGSEVTLTVTNSQFLNNTAGFGGAIEASLNSLTTITGTTIDRNTATVNGGGIQNDDQSTLILTNSSLSNNRADRDGGGLFGRGNFTIVNSTLSNNTAARNGGGIARSNPSNTTTLLNSTIASNQAGLEGGGIYAEPNATATVLRNTIVATNANPNSPDVRGNFNDQGNNLIGITNGRTGFTRSPLVGTATNPIDPKLAPLTQSGTVQIRALQVGSPAIDAGSNLDAPTTDQQGSIRIVSGTIDIGAVESNFAADPVSPDPISAPKINPTDLTIVSPALSSLAQLSQPNQGIIRLEQSLNRDFEQYFGLTNSSPVSTADIQNTLTQVQQQKGIRTGIIYAMFVPRSTPPAPPTGEPKEGESIFPLLRPQKRDDDRLDLILITATGQAIRYSTTADRAQVTQQAKLFRLAASDAEDPNGYVALSKQLYGWLLQPLEPELKKARIVSLIYCLDEGLRTVPIAALSDETGFVISRYAVSVTPSMSLIDRRLTQLTGQTLLAMGADRFQALDPLPAVPTELNLISQQLWRGKRFLNQDFTLATLIAQKQQFNPGILHLATHAQFNAGAPDRSYIQLWDTQIRFSQLRSLQLDKPPIDLLVLSACATAVGSPDAELGFAGLAAASGVRSILGSLWDVSDIGTLALMSEFYTELRTAPTRVEALRRAQLSLLTGKVRIENGSLITSQGRFSLPANLTPAKTIAFIHPFYWSAFTLVGNPW
ncbi:CHAT domain-containing protein [Phormidesmis sp. 146-35]